jgi:hypothetical protein
MTQVQLLHCCPGFLTAEQGAGAELQQLLLWRLL